MTIEAKSKEWGEYIAAEKFNIIKQVVRNLAPEQVSQYASSFDGTAVKTIKFFHKDLPIQTFTEKTFEVALECLESYIALKLKQLVAAHACIHIDKVHGWIEEDKSKGKFDVGLEEGKEGEFQQLEPMVQFMLKITIEIWEQP